MKYSEIRNELGVVPIDRIIQSESVTLNFVINHPEKMDGKVLLFFGNYAGFKTRGPVIRVFKYLKDIEKWTVWDRDLDDNFEECFDAKFTKEAVERHSEFHLMLLKEGYLLDDE